MKIILSNFKIIRPRYEENQNNCFAWLERAHAFVKTNHEEPSTKTLEENTKTMHRFIEKFCCSSDKISSRGSEIADFFEADYSKMKIFNLTQSPYGASLQERMNFFKESTNRLFEEFFLNVTTPPQNLIHVTCTGYTSPSPAQLLVSKKNWGELCEVTSAYHMGCYASIPALRMAQGFLKNEITNNENERVDIVHTELCTLHFNPAIHTPEQFVIQSLFSDGFISYSLSKNTNKMENPTKNKNAFEILALQEIIYPECHSAMTWDLSNYGFAMTISRTVPSIISENIEKFLIKLFEKANFSFPNEKENILWAIHPGGPKIIEYIADILQLSDEKIKYSKEILFKYGNMSSATLPHVWELISSSAVNKNTLIVSLAFGPGLTIAGSLMKIL